MGNWVGKKTVEPKIKLRRSNLRKAYGDEVEPFSRGSLPSPFDARRCAQRARSSGWAGDASKPASRHGWPASKGALRPPAGLVRRRLGLRGEEVARHDDAYLVHGEVRVVVALLEVVAVDEALEVAVEILGEPKRPLDRLRRLRRRRRRGLLRLRCRCRRCDHWRRGNRFEILLKRLPGTDDSGREVSEPRQRLGRLRRRYRRRGLVARAHRR